MIFILSLLALGMSAGCVGLLLGTAHGIEIERKRRPVLRVVGEEPAGQEGTG